MNPGWLAAHPWLILGLSIATVVGLIAWARVHAFFALLAAAALVAVLAGVGPGAAAGVERVLAELGAMAGRIGFAIAVAAVSGAALLASGAADRIVRSFIAVLGERRAPLALLGAGFVLGVPVFFDTVFFLLIPLARALTARTGRDYLLHVLAISAGSVITHATVPPTPGPLAMAELLHLDLGVALVAGVALGLAPAAAAWAFAGWRNRREPLALTAAPGAGAATLPPAEAEEAGAAPDGRALPGFGVAIAPVVVPVALIALDSIRRATAAAWAPALAEAVAFFGNKNVALLLGAVLAVGVCLRQRGWGWRESGRLVGAPLEAAGVIILITAAGGAYGALIKLAGIGDAVRDTVAASGLSPVWLAWGMAALLRAAQGSTTVAVITTAGLLTTAGGGTGLGVHPLCLYLAIGYGGLFLSWMNDSGFWLFSRMTGLDERQTWRNWSMLLNVIALAGLAEAWLLSLVLPGGS